MSDLSAPLSPWRRFRYRLEWAACAGLAALIPRLSRRFCARLARGVGALAFRLDRRGRAVARANLLCAFGEDRDAAWRDRVALRSYQNFVRTMLDLLWAPRLTPENWRDYIETEGTPLPAQVEGHGAVLMCAHWGNFEWASLAVGFLGLPVTIVAENFKNPLLSEVFNCRRQVSGHTIIPQENSMVRLLKIVKRRGVTGMLVDLTLRPERGAVPLEAFGRKMAVTPLHAILAARGGARLLPVHGIPLPDGRCRIVFDPPVVFPEDCNAATDPARIVQACWEGFERRIREEPELWMWAYKHWRYRPGGAAPEAYPFYANVSAKFDRLLAGRPAAAKKRPLRPSSAMENGAAH